MSIKARTKYIQQDIYQTEIASGRAPGSVQLLAVSKGQPVSALREAYQAGLRDFAESYWQEAQVKIHELTDLVGIRWHFIGPLQSNKTKQIAQHFHWVHSVSRHKIAELLDAMRPSHLPPLNICIQVNLDKEITKEGVTAEELEALLAPLPSLKRLRLRGLMMIPKPSANEAAQYQSFLRLTSLLHTLNQHLHLSMDSLSMGMSHDYQAAIRAGSTLIRIGTAIFGNRRSLL